MKASPRDFESEKLSDFEASDSSERDLEGFGSMELRGGGGPTGLRTCSKY